MADLLRARPGPDPALHGLPPPGRQDPGLRLPPGPPAHPAHPCPRGGAGRGRHRPRLRLNVALTEAIALGHDCGHGPGGHASEDALDPFVAGGFDHAPWGAGSPWRRSTCAPRRSTASPTTAGRGRRPSTPEGEVVSWADRIAYVCHDWEDAVLTGIVGAATSRGGARAVRGPPQRAARRVHRRRRLGLAPHGPGRHGGRGGGGAGRLPRLQLRADLPARGLVAPGRGGGGASCGRWSSTSRTGRTSWPTTRAGGAPADVLAGSEEAVRAAVTYVAGMTDRFAFRQAVALLGWDPAKLPGRRRRLTPPALTAAAGRAGSPQPG